MLKASFQNTLNTPIIYLNSNLDEHEIKCVISHELGHAILHKDLNVCFLKHYTFSVTDRYENEANKFTSELLIDDNMLIDIMEINNLITIDELSKYFYIPTGFISYKFTHLNFN
ncbi:ImmA/IrrE family metallo-endopeptidase [Paraclostridium sordellii]|uniref:ImmA/IrrE family metallo-endopeptidase n=1 Tax=Paraclostridium sordellii TaxID=1505 RepID=UPI0009BE954B